MVENQWVAGVITLISRVITLLIAATGPTSKVFEQILFLSFPPASFSWHNFLEQNAYITSQTSRIFSFICTLPTWRIMPKPEPFQKKVARKGGKVDKKNMSTSQTPQPKWSGLGFPDTTWAAKKRTMLGCRKRRKARSSLRSGKLRQVVFFPWGFWGVSFKKTWGMEIP